MTQHMSTTGFAKFHIFYGILMDSNTLTKSISCARLARTLPCGIGWVSVHALGPLSCVTKRSLRIENVRGGIRSSIAKGSEYLQAYETEGYTAKPCLIDLEHGRKLEGKLLCAMLTRLC